MRRPGGCVVAEPISRRSIARGRSRHPCLRAGDEEYDGPRVARRPVRESDRHLVLQPSGMGEPGRPGIGRLASLGARGHGRASRRIDSLHDAGGRTGPIARAGVSARRTASRYQPRGRGVRVRIHSGITRPRLVTGNDRTLPHPNRRRACLGGGGARPRSRGFRLPQRVRNRRGPPRGRVEPLAG